MSLDLAGAMAPGAQPGPELRYRSRLAEGVFEIQRCRACGNHLFYPRVLCKFCGGTDLAWERPSGRGTVYSSTVIRRRAEEGGDYNVSVIELDEGPRMMSRVDGEPPSGVHIGQRVKAMVSGRGKDALLVFVPETSEVEHG